MVIYQIEKELTSQATNVIFAQDIQTNRLACLKIWLPGTTPLTGERAQAILRGRPRGRLGTAGSGNGCLRGRPRGRFGPVGSDPAFLRDRLDCLGSIQGAGAIL